MIEQMSRRDFLRAGGLLLLTGVGMRFGLDRLLAPLELDERRSTFKRLHAESETPEGRKVFRSWLLFQAAQGYAASRGDWLTAEAQQRYLFGDRSEWNITPAITKHLLSRNGPFNGAVRDPHHALTLFYQNIIQQGFDNARKIDNSFDAGIPPVVMEHHVEKQHPFDLHSQSIADGGGVSRDVLSTLGRFTVYNDGSIHRVRPVETKTEHGWRLDQHGGTAHLYDYHDWNHTEPDLLGGKITAADVVINIITPLGAKDPRAVAKNLFGTDGLHDLEDMKVEIRGADAIRLENHGLAKPFPIVTSPHEMRAVSSWYIPKHFFSKEPDFSP